jgi:hypothetical protein
MFIALYSSLSHFILNVSKNFKISVNLSFPWNSSYFPSNPRNLIQIDLKVGLEFYDGRRRLAGLEINDFRKRGDK